MPVVADIAEEFYKALEAFRPHFGAPAFEHFKRPGYSLRVTGLFGIDQKPRGKTSTLGELITGTMRKVFGGLVEWITLQVNSGRTREDICRIAYGF